jgi:peptidoglycan LD-endopeptidase CwlK
MVRPGRRRGRQFIIGFVAERRAHLVRRHYRNREQYERERVIVWTIGARKRFATLLPQVQPYARALVKKAAQHGITIKVIAGLRTYEEQNELFAQGRTKPGRIVTNARGGFSNHNFGIAFDVGVFEGANYLDESPKYKAVGALGRDLGLEWGGNWKTFVDEPHFQLRPKWAGDVKESVMLAELRTRKDSGKGAYA